MSEIRSQATPAYLAVANRRAATHALHHDLLDGGPKIDAKFSDIHHMAGNAIRHGWSKPRTVNSAAELDALPNMTVVMDNCDDVSQKRGGQWCGYETADLTSKQIAKYGPLTVLFTPGDAG